MDFGKQLRTFRQQCSELKTGKAISQQKLGEFLREEMGVRYSGAAISDWERNKSKINADERILLISLIKILKRHGGIKTLADANILLEAGNYRDLNLIEQQQLFPGTPREPYILSPATIPQRRTPYFKFLLSISLFNSPEELDRLLSEANEGPPPAWPRVAVALLKRVTDQWSIFHVLRVLLWLWIWLLTYLLIAPSLQWPFATQENALQVMVLYAGGTMILPPFIGAIVNTKDKVFWKKQKISNTLATRLYVHQGACIGFHLGYFIIFPLAVIQNQFGIRSSDWIEFMKMTIPIVVGYAAAQLVPYNLWLAYKRLHLRDGAVFFVFAILGPAWAWFFLEFNKSIGIFTLLTALTLLTGAMALQYHRKKNTIIPILWWVIFYGLILICQIASLLIQ